MASLRWRKSTRFIAGVTSWLPEARIASTITSGAANLPVPVKRWDSNVLSAIRNMSASSDNLKKQDPIAFLQEMIFPPVARQDVLIERQRNAAAAVRAGSAGR